MPALPTWLIPRRRLTDRLARAVDGPLTVVVGPAGAGKTALAVEWAHTRRPPGPLAWVTCDGRTEQPDVFWQRVAGALRSAGVEVPEVVTPGDRGLLVAGLATALSDRREPVTLVLDDFETAPSSPVADGVTRLLRHTSGVLRMVVLSRRDPPLHVRRGRLARDVTELRTADLAFDDRETAALLAQHGIDVPQQTVTALRRRTDGWAAGLRLAAMSMEKHHDPVRFVAQFTGEDEAIAGYLVEEVLDLQSPDMRRLLLATSLLESVNAELAAELAGADAGCHFAALVRENSFLYPVGEGWYRCHRMFADVLRRCLHHEEPGLVAVLHRRAAAWLDGHGRFAEAVRHLLAAGDWDQAARLVVHRLAIGQVLGVARVRLPVEETRRPCGVAPAQELEPALFTAAVAHAHGDDQTCARILEQCARLLAPLSPGLSPWESEHEARCRLTYAVIRMEVLRTRNPRQARAAAAEAEAAGLRLPHRAWTQNPEIAALILTIRGSGELRAGCLTAAEASLTAGLKAAGAAENGVLRRDCLVELALLDTLRGRFRAADELAARASRPPLPAWTTAEPSRATLHLVGAWVELARGEPGRARREVARCEGLLSGRPDTFLSEIGKLVAVLSAEMERGRFVRAPIGDAVAGARLPGAVHRTLVPACALLLGSGGVGPSAVTTIAVDGADGVSAPAERLSVREQDVLARLAQMMTNEEIAQELYLSVNTVKTHLKSVYRKLSVSRRSAAVRRARELQLL
ncbi:helix-turn-helix transcriptional regulator [Streptomyces sp. ERV7]|nr:LuxR family transcriptional regulator [Streptomyces sp. ERV7]OAR22037.1 helix-turn-helix transcriptional regulator [Streptomyces sp. ERV7]